MGRKFGAALRQRASRRPCSRLDRELRFRRRYSDWQPSPRATDPDIFRARARARTAARARARGPRTRCSTGRVMIAELMDAKLTAAEPTVAELTAAERIATEPRQAPHASQGPSVRLFWRSAAYARSAAFGATNRTFQYGLYKLGSSRALSPRRCGRLKKTSARASAPMRPAGACASNKSRVPLGRTLGLRPASREVASGL